MDQIAVVLSLYRSSSHQLNFVADVVDTLGCDGHTLVMQFKPGPPSATGDQGTDHNHILATFQACLKHAIRKAIIVADSCERLS